MCLRRSNLKQSVSRYFNKNFDQLIFSILDICSVLNICAFNPEIKINFEVDTIGNNLVCPFEFLKALIELLFLTGLKKFSQNTPHRRYP
jgi:hypothetical protein